MLVCPLKGYWTTQRAGTYLSAWVKGSGFIRLLPLCTPTLVTLGSHSHLLGMLVPPLWSLFQSCAVWDGVLAPSVWRTPVFCLYGSHIFPIFLKLPYSVFCRNSNWTLCCCFTSMSSISSFFLRRMSKSSSLSSNDRSSGTGERGGGVNNVRGKLMRLWTGSGKHPDLPTPPHRDCLLL